MAKFPVRWVKLAFALSGSALLIVLVVWVTLMWATATTGG